MAFDVVAELGKWLVGKALESTPCDACGKTTNNLTSKMKHGCNVCSRCLEKAYARGNGDRCPGCGDLYEDL